MTAFVHKDDCAILRGDDALNHSPSRPQKALLIDSDGDLVFQFPEEWTDEQIWHALLFVNAKYDYGIKLGADIARNHMKLALGINS